MDTRRSVAEAAFIFGEHHSFIKAVVLSKTRCHDDADELMQRVFIALVRAHAPRAHADVRRYLYAVVCNCVADYYRDIERRKRMKTDYSHGLPRAIKDSTPVAHAARQEALTRILLFISNRLEQRQQQAVLLRYMHDKTMQEIAAEMHMEPRSVRRHLRRAVRALRVAVLSEPDSNHDAVDTVHNGR